MNDAELRKAYAAAKIINPLPPEPSVGSGVALFNRPDVVIYRRVSRACAGWRMPEWGPHIPSTTWRHIALTYAEHLVLADEPNRTETRT